MATDSPLKKDWEVTPEAFEKLLFWLDPDIEVAAEKYEKVRQKLIKLFKWRNCIPEEEYADITINRVTRRVYENTPVEVADAYSYFHGTALNVMREYWRGKLKHKHEEIGELDRAGKTAKHTEQLLDEEAQEAAKVNRHGCMRECLRELPADSRDLIVAYHHGDNKKEIRRSLAEKLKVPINVLRIRVCRIREGLQKCVSGCMKEAV
jgi:DNA-directed RNA polymerase specialized sigma24 family protein